MRTKTKKTIKTVTFRMLAVLLTVVITAVGIPFTATAESSAPAPNYVTASIEKALWAEGTTATTTNNIDAVKWYEKDGTYYWFLPSSADLSNLTVYHNFSRVEVNGTTIISGNSYNMFENNQTYTITADGTTYSLSIQKANGIGSMFLTTESGSMSNVHSNKENKESGQLVAIDYDGSVSYDNALDYIKGRGNTTWRFNKKPYNIKLDKKTSLLGMDKNKKWCLLANAQDHSMIRNTIMYNLADEVGLEYSPDSRFVDLYANGEYLGTYQLTQKVEAGDGDLVNITDLEAKTEEAVAAGTGLTDFDLEELYGDDYYSSEIEEGEREGYNIPYNPDDITGGYLIEFVMEFDEASYFTTAGGQKVQVKNPEYCSAEQINYIADFMQDLEDAVYSTTGYNEKGKHYTEYIDIESAALMYLLQEFSVNVDGGISSCYFYKDSDLTGDGKLHASPCWDFDVALGNLNQDNGWSNTMNYDDWFTRYFYRYSPVPTIFAQLCYHDDFWNEVQKLYEERFSLAFDILTGKTEGTRRLQSMYDYDALISPSSVMNYTRWDLEDTLLVAESGTTQDEQMVYLETFINGRIEFLDSNLLIENIRENYIASFDYILSVWQRCYSDGTDDELTALAEATAIIEQAKIDIANATSISDFDSLYYDTIDELQNHHVTTIHFDNSKTKWDNVYIYCKSNDRIDYETDEILEEGTALAEWPGIEMTYLGDDLYSFTYKGSTYDISQITFTNGETAESGNKHQTYTSYSAYYISPGYDNIYTAQPTVAEYNGDEQAYMHLGKWANEQIRGDVSENCEVDLMDSVLIMKHLLGTTELSGVPMYCADVDYNEEVELLDAVYIQKYLLGLITEFPYNWDY